MTIFFIIIHLDALLFDLFDRPIRAAFSVRHPGAEVCGEMSRSSIPLLLQVSLYQTGEAICLLPEIDVIFARKRI
jgi:hypothetical protein